MGTAQMMNKNTRTEKNNILVIAKTMIDESDEKHEAKESLDDN